jgi:DNA-binding MarR family transcriptional regulator
MPDRTQDLGTLLKAVNRGVFEVIQDTLHQHGLPAPTMAVMHQVHRAPGTTVSDLARQTHLAKSHVSKTVESLAGMGFLEKRPDPDDQRLLRIYPAEKAKTHFQGMDALINKRMSAVLSSLPPERVDAIIEGLELLKEALEQSKKEMTQGAQTH